MEVAQDFGIKGVVADAIEEIERRAEAWEFNNKHLMYSPASSNWADEYPVEGYILLNNVLRLWMLTKASRLLSSDIYADKAGKVSVRLSTISLVSLLNPKVVYRFATETSQGFRRRRSFTYELYAWRNVKPY